MKYWIFLILALVLVSGCAKQQPKLTLEEIKFPLEACGGEAERLSNVIDDQTMSPRQKAEICEQAIEGIEKCEEKILDIEDDFSSESAEDAAILEYLDDVKHKVYVADVLSKACTCEKTKEDFDSRIQKDVTLSGKQILRGEKYCAMRQSCTKLIDGTLATTAAREEASKKFEGLELDSPLLFFSEESAKDFTAYCTDMLADLDNKISSSEGEAREHLEIEKAVKHQYCTEKALTDFDERLLPDWMVILGRGPTQDAENTLEKYREKYDIKFEGDEFNCPAVPFKLDIVEKTSADGSASTCNRGVQDSCASVGGTLDPKTCKCESKKAAENCETYASSFASIGTNPTNIDYSEGISNGLSEKEACKSYAYQNILQSGFCNGKDQQLYAIYNSNNNCCVRYWAESLNQPTIGSGDVFCGYEQRLTSSGIWQEVSGTEEGDFLYHADWLGQYAFPSAGETCQEVESRNEGGIIYCQ